MHTYLQYIIAVEVETILIIFHVERVISSASSCSLLYFIHL
jgi:hypothetical protein